MSIRLFFLLCMTCQAYLFPKLYFATLKNTFDFSILLNVTNTIFTADSYKLLMVVWIVILIESILIW